MREWLRGLAALLPADTARDLFIPSLLDLEVDWAERRRAATSVRRAVANARLVAGTLLVLIECARLAFLLWVRRRVTLSRRSPAPRRRREFLTMVSRDIRHALRLFRRDPVFTAAAVLTLALGIGANTALFAVVEAVLLRPLPFAGDDVVMLRYRDTRTGLSKDFVALGDVIDVRARQRSFRAVVPYNTTQAALVGEGDPIRVEGLTVGPELFAALGVEPALGRFFEAGDTRQGAPDVAVISYALWTTRFGSNPDVVGRSIEIGPSRRTIVGVAPRGFRFPPSATTDILLPMRLPEAAPAERRAWIHAVARLAPGVTREQANAELARLSQQFAAEFPESNRGIEYDVLSVRDAVVGDTKRALLLMLGAVGFVLLIACANVGNLLIARSLARRQEMTLRLALGAGRLRLVGQMLIEGVVLAAAGGAVGVLLAWQAAPALAAVVPQARPIPGLEDVSINATVLAFSLAVSMLSAALFSLLAGFGLTGSTADIAATRRTTMSAGARRAASALVAAEVAVATVLLIGAGLTLRSFANLAQTDPGFRADGVVNVQLALPPGRYAEGEARRELYRRLFATLRGMPGVEEVGAGVVTPLTGNNWTVPLQRPETPLAAGERAPDVGWQLASRGYFGALRIPLKAGRLFDERDAGDAPPVVVISEALAARYFAGEQPLGRRVVLGNLTAEIVGVVGDIKRAALTDDPRADMYLPFEREGATSVGLFVRTAGDPVALLPAMQAAMRRLEPNLVLFGARSMRSVVADAAAIAELAMRLLAGFAAVALLLAAIGLYGVMSYSVRRRTREMGTRLALGAGRGAIVTLVLRQAMTVTVIGLACGLAAGLAAARSLRSILHGVPPWDPLSIAGAAAVLLLAALLAGYLPARRAARIDPARTLAVE